MIFLQRLSTTCYPDKLAGLVLCGDRSDNSVCFKENNGLKVNLKQVKNREIKALQFK